jgi:hypothetical protein
MPETDTTPALSPAPNAALALLLRTDPTAPHIFEDADPDVAVDSVRRDDQQTLQIVDEYAGAVAYVWSTQLAQAITAALRIADGNLATDPYVLAQHHRDLIAAFRSATDSIRNGEG